MFLFLNGPLSWMKKKHRSCILSWQTARFKWVLWLERTKWRLGNNRKLNDTAFFPYLPSSVISFSFFLFANFCLLLKFFPINIPATIWYYLSQPRIPNPESGFWKVSKCHHKDFWVHMIKVNHFSNHAESTNKSTY